MKYSVFILIVSFISTSLFAQRIDEITVGIDEEFYSTKKTVRVTDGIGKGLSKDIAMRNAIIDARKKALVRVTSTFRHYLSASKDGEFVDKSVAEEVHARIIDRENIISVNYDHGLNFAPYHVAVVDAEVKVRFLDLDFFATEMTKTAEAACIRSLFISGWGQFFNRSYFAGVSFGLVTYGSLGYGFYRDNQISAARKSYQEATTATEAERRYQVLQNHRRVARTLYVLGVASWAYSVWEAFEDRERADEVLDVVHKKFFPKFRYTRTYSPIQRFIMNGLRPTW